MSSQISGMQNSGHWYSDAVYVGNGANKPAPGINEGAPSPYLLRQQDLQRDNDRIHAAPGEFVAAKRAGLQMDAEQLKKVESSLNAKFADGSLLKNAVNLNDRFEPSSQAVSDVDGKKIIDKREDVYGFLVRTTNQPGYTPESANEAAKNGASTHGFLYRESDFLFDAANSYAKLADDEDFRYRNIRDEGFVRDSLDFFTNGNYTEDDVRKMQDQMTDLVREMAKQVRSGETPDLDKLQTKLTVGGADVTISELINMQTTGRKLSRVLNDIGIGNQIDAVGFGKVGIAKAVGHNYGASRGEIGAKFSEAIDRMYDKALSRVSRIATEVVEKANDGSGIYWRKTYKEVEKSDFQIADLLSKLDMSSKAAASKDLNAKMKQVDGIIEDYCRQHDVPADSFKRAGDKDALMKYMESWLNG
ncbi:MAG: hypothetical protein J5449_10045 [Oscillospiraceae bacterium]|nr:hypothetical protein [Oscillospiraceae bacterium]